MTKDQVKGALEWVPTWPEDRQQEPSEVALEIEAGLAEAGYQAMLDELAPIDEGLAREAASEEEVKAALPYSGQQPDIIRLRSIRRDNHAHCDGSRPYPLFPHSTVTRRGRTADENLQTRLPDGRGSPAGLDGRV